MNTRTALGMPARDWRFWAAIAAALLVACVAVAFVSTLGDKQALRAQNLELLAQQANTNDVAECRAAAAVFSDAESERSSAIQSLGLVAALNHQDASPYKDALNVARRNALKALDAREDAVTRCTDDPSYRIDPATLEPVPTLPAPP
jgi:hypothetical protein